MNTKYRVAVGDDDQTFSMILRAWLEKEGHSVAVYDQPEAFLEGVRRTIPDVAFLDVLFGAGDGCEICRVLRNDEATRGIAVIMVSGLRREIEDMAEGLESGADDYMGKPLDRRLTLAKMHAVMQRFKSPAELEPVLRLYGLTLDPRARRVRAGGKDVLLTRLEFDLLTYLLRHPGKVLAAQQLLDAVWGYDPEKYSDPSTVHVHISRLRKKLGSVFSKKLVTLVNTGYRLG